MNLEIHKPELVQRVNAHIRNGHFHDANELIEKALDALDEKGSTSSTATKKEPTRSLRGLLAKYGPAPSAEEIDQNRAEMFANFPRSDF